MWKFNLIDFQYIGINPHFH